MNRCAWVPADDPLYVAYHDEEWGVPVRDERTLFELLNLEGAQAGLSWSTILRKREGYRSAFAGWDIDAIARFGERDVERLLGDAGIVRHRGKIEAVIGNARATRELEDGAAHEGASPGAGSDGCAAAAGGSAAGSVSVGCAGSPGFARGSRMRAGTPTASLPAGTSVVTTAPAPVRAPSPMSRGATIIVSTPMKAPSPMVVGCLFVPS